MIKKTKISHGELIERITYFPKTGKFVWTDSKYNGTSKNKPAGTRYKDDGCALIQIGGERWTDRQLAWYWVTGEVPQGQVKPINGDPVNCCFDNLDYVPAKNGGHKHIHYGGNGDKAFNVRKDGIHYGKAKTLMDALKIRDSFPELL